MVVFPDARDRRVRAARLTRAGARERDELDRRADEAATRVLERLSPDQRRRLTAAMEDVERLLTASMVEVGIEDPGGADARWARDRHFAELDDRFDEGFDPALSASADAAELTLPAGALLLARLRGRPVGCGAVRLHEPGVGLLKRMWVAPEARGLGLGRRLLQELEAVATERGVTVLRLETNRSLTEAIGLYRSAGYREVPAFSAEAFAYHWLEKRMA